MKLIIILCAVALFLVSCSPRSTVKVFADQAHDVVMFPALAAIQDSDQAGLVHVQAVGYAEGVKGLYKRFLKLEEAAAMAARKGYLWGLAMILMVSGIGLVIIWFITKNGMFLTWAIGTMIGSVLTMGIAQYLCEYWKIGAVFALSLMGGGIGYTLYHMIKERRQLVGSVRYGQALEEKVDDVTVSVIRDTHRDKHMSAGIYPQMKKLVNQVRGDA